MKLALTGNQIRVGDILTGVWWFPNGEGEVISLSPYEGRLKYFAGEGSQVATIRGTSHTLMLSTIDWWIVHRRN